MSGLVERVKEKVRSRSISRKRRSTTQYRSDEPRQSSEYVDARASQEVTNNNPARVSSPANASWHVHKGVRSSVDGYQQSQPPVPQVDQRYNADAVPTQSNGAANPVHAHRHTTSNASDTVPARYSSLRSQQTADYQNDERGRSNLPYNIPPRKESLPHDRYDQGTTVDNQNTIPQTRGVPHEGTIGEDGRYTTALPRQTRTNDLGTEIDQALADLSVNERPHNGAAATSTTRKALPGSAAEHLRTPANFDLGHSEHTYIDTQWREAVTQEDIYHHRTEIVQESITRDIHIHHYYTYVQPIKVTEVLPAKHYVMDEATGRKVEISAPVGFELPLDMRPRLEDTTAIAGWERHYLVDEQYPNGTPEPPPTSSTSGDRHHQDHSYTIRNE